eukprot:scaffold3444_cov57-Phaeocystis_antarctica.AAC.2
MHAICATHGLHQVWTRRKDVVRIEHAKARLCPRGGRLSGVHCGHRREDVGALVVVVLGRPRQGLRCEGAPARGATRRIHVAPHDRPKECDVLEAGLAQLFAVVCVRVQEIVP